MTKQEIRQLIKLQKLTLTDSERRQAAHAVFAKVERLTAFTAAKRILLYNSLPDELPTREFINKWSAHKQIFLPKVNGENLDILPYEPQRMQLGAFNIEEPQGNDTAEPETMDLIIVPGVAFDQKGNRLGRGKGFYDRLLSQTHATTIGVGYDSQLIPSGIPIEPHDKKLDIIITDSHIFQDSIDTQN